LSCPWQGRLLQGRSRQRPCRKHLLCWAGGILHQLIWPVSVPHSTEACRPLTVALRCIFHQSEPFSCPASTLELLNFSCPTDAEASWARALLMQKHPGHAADSGCRRGCCGAVEGPGARCCCLLPVPCRSCCPEGEEQEGGHSFASACAVQLRCESRGRASAGVKPAVRATCTCLPARHSPKASSAWPPAASWHRRPLSCRPAAAGAVRRAAHRAGESLAQLHARFEGNGLSCSGSGSCAQHPVRALAQWGELYACATASVLVPIPSSAVHTNFS